LPFQEATTSDEDESPLIAWLFHVTRNERGLTRVMAARLITALFRLGFAKKHRVPMMAYLLIPVLLRMLDKDYEVPIEADLNKSSSISATCRVKEEAPAVLASLIMDTRDLQKTAVDGGAIKKLAQLLKSTFQSTPSQEKPMWWASEKPPPTTDDPTLRLGPPGLPPLVLHKMKFREAILKALAAISLFREEYRKAICDNGIVPFVIDSMKPYEPEAAAGKEHGECLDLNPIPILLAACATAKSLTRSVSVLRTSLIDAGVAPPIFNLVKHRDIEVQTAASAVVCNLAMDFSPMREVSPTRPLCVVSRSV
jgi:hypothetical protein